MKIAPTQHKSAFTLVELSVVLVIIGLLVAGVLAAQDMIRAAQIRATISDFGRYHTAIQMFRDKYGYLPGDIPNATDFWPSCTDAGANTCNGDGNHQYVWNTEAYRAWQHLSLAGMVGGSYTGTATNNEGVIGTNVPAAGPDGVAYYLSYGTSYGLYPRNKIAMGKEVTNSNPAGSALSPTEAWTIDKKIDDGVPRKGKLIGDVGSGASGCSISGGLEYNTSSSNIVCVVNYRID